MQYAWQLPTRLPINTCTLASIVMRSNFDQYCNRIKLIIMWQFYCGSRQIIDGEVLKLYKFKWSLLFFILGEQGTFCLLLHCVFYLKLCNPFIVSLYLCINQQVVYGSCYSCLLEHYRDSNLSLTSGTRTDSP